MHKGYVLPSVLQLCQMQSLRCQDGLLSELLCINDIVLMSETVEGLRNMAENGRKLSRARANF